MDIIEYEEIGLLKQSEKSTVLLIREIDSERIFVKKILTGQHTIYSVLFNCPHPYLPKLCEVIVSDSTTTIIEEYIDGQSLESANLSEEQLLTAFNELCSVVGFLHGKGIIHRDIKPSNVILTKDGHICLIDFDAARICKNASEQEQDTKLLGTRGYAPPEQYGFAQTDIRTDIYALGVTLEQLLGENAQKYRYRNIIKKCTDWSPEKRYQSVQQMQKELNFPYRKHCCFLGIIAMVLICIVCVFIFNPSQGQTDQILSPQIFEAPYSEYISISELDVEEGQSVSMQVDMTGNGEWLEFTIAYNGEHGLAGTTAKSIAKSTKGIEAGLWFEDLQELLHGISYEQSYSDEDTIIQITCIDVDNDGVKEIFVTRGDNKNAVVTAVWQFISANEGSNGAYLALIGTMWGVSNMRLDEDGTIKADVHKVLPELVYYYKRYHFYGFLGNLGGMDLSTYKKFQYFQYNMYTDSEPTDFNWLDSFPSGKELFDFYNVSCSYFD